MEIKDFINFEHIRNRTQRNKIFRYGSEEFVESPEWSIGYFDFEGINTYSLLAYYISKMKGFHGSQAIDKLLDGENKSGTYIEIGVGHYKEGNNSYLLENIGWEGVSLDIDENVVSLFNSNRSDKCFQGDAMTFNWDKHLSEANFPSNFDYLSIDIDHVPKREANLLALINFPIQRYRPLLITLEHAVNLDYTLESLRDCQRKILSSLGYSLIIQGTGDDIWLDMKDFSLNDILGLSNIRNRF